MAPSEKTHSTILFTKMHGLGNDYIYINSFDVSLDGMDIPALARAMSDRHRGIGADGLILIQPPAGDEPADLRMEMYNADGTRGEMCGNGIRCVGKYALEHGLIRRPERGVVDLLIQTDRGVLALQARVRSGRVDEIRVDMGPPILNPAEIPVALPGERCVGVELPASCRSLLHSNRYRMTCISMGNPHAVINVNALEEIDLETFGPAMECDVLFPQRVNVHLALVRSRREVAMRTWERGSGITQACGTGACAVLVAGVLEDRLDRNALVHLPGGVLQIEWAETSQDMAGSVFMTGPATEVFSGRWPV